MSTPSSQWHLEHNPLSQTLASAMLHPAERSPHSKVHPMLLTQHEAPHHISDNVGWGASCSSSEMNPSGSGVPSVGSAHPDVSDHSSCTQSKAPQDTSSRSAAR
eukprot:6471231-Amphidinium_carterae.3